MCLTSRTGARLKPSRYVVLLGIAITMGAAGVALRAQNPIQPPTDTPAARDPLTPAPNRAPGEGFGAPGYLRISFARPMEELREGVQRLAAFLAARRTKMTSA